MTGETRVARLLRRAAASVLVRNAAALYGVQAASLLLPLVSIPYLARTLTPDGWGLVVFSQSFSIWLMLLLHYGFAFSATRSVARHRDDAAALRGIVSGVQGAKLYLLLATLVLTLAAALWVPLFRAHPAYLWWAWAAALAQGFNPLWYFQGVERMTAPALLDVVARACAVGGIFLFVHAPSDGWRVLALQAAAGAVTAGVTTVWMYRATGFALPTHAEARAALHEGRSVFVFTGAASAYTTSNSFILGLLAGPQAVAFFGAADKLTRAAVGLLAPISQALYPRISHLTATDEVRADALLRRALGPFLLLGCAGGAFLAIAAPWLVPLVFGPGYDAAVPVLRVLALLAPILALGTVLGIQWALPRGLDRPYATFAVAAGVVNILLALWFVPRLGALGMASAAVLAEMVVEGGLIWLVLRERRLRRGALAEAAYEGAPSLR